MTESATSVDLSTTTKMKVGYAYDTTKQGFYWAGSQQKRREIMAVVRGAPAVFEATYQGRPGAREGSIFLSADLNAFYSPPPDLHLGMLSPEIQQFCSRGHAVLQSWDTASSLASQAAHSVCVTSLLVPCSSYHCNEDPAIFGPCEFHFDVLLLDIFRKKLDWGQLLAAAKELNQLWRPQHIIIENKSSGIQLISELLSTLPVIGITPVDSKAARALTSVGELAAGSAQGWFRQHRVLTPPSAPWLEPWRREMKDFSGASDAASDQVDATVHLIRHAINLGATAATLPSDWTPERSELSPHALAAEQFNYPDLADNPDPRAQFLISMSELPNLSEDPFSGTCARCVNFRTDSSFCARFSRRVVAMDSCGDFEDAVGAAQQSELGAITSSASFRS